MRVHRPVPRAGGSRAVLLGGVLVALAAALPALGPPAAAGPSGVVPPATGLLLTRHAGGAPVTLDTTRLTGPALRAWWTDAVGDRTVDGGTVSRGPAVTLHPPDTGDGSPHDWTLVVVDATRGLVPPA